MDDVLRDLQRLMQHALGTGRGRRACATEGPVVASQPALHRSSQPGLQPVLQPRLQPRPHRASRPWMLPLLLTCSLTLGGCDRKPTKVPSSPEPPRPKMSPDGYRQSLLGNAILSNALLSYKVQCNEQRASIRICRIPAQVHTNREALGT